MRKSSDVIIDDPLEKYIDHEVRIRIQEHLANQINNKMNIGLTLIVLGLVGPLIFPIIIKWLGWA